MNGFEIDIKGEKLTFTWKLFKNQSSKWASKYSKLTHTAPVVLSYYHNDYYYGGKNFICYNETVKQKLLLVI